MTSEPTLAAADPAELQARSRIVSVINQKWKVDRLLGIGGMASVYAATHRNGARAALKVLHRELGLNADVKERFHREGYVANTVDHPGTVKVLDDDVMESGEPYLVMELLEGESVENRLSRHGQLPLAEALAITHQLVSVLASAHSKGILHRDIKPENLYLTSAGVLKVLDFGIARLRDSTSNSSATRTGTVMGTPSFMPPEQARGLTNEIDGRTDLWAAGATLFALLTGKAPHEGRTANEVLLSAMTKPVAPLASLAPNVPLSIAGFVDQSLAFEPSERFQDAGEMLRGLQAAWDGSGFEGVPGQPADLANVLLTTSVVMPTHSSQPGQPRIPSQPSRSTAGAFAQTAVPEIPGAPKKSKAGLFVALGVAAAGAVGVAAFALKGSSSAPVAAPATEVKQESGAAAAPQSPPPSAATAVTERPAGLPAAPVASASASPTGSSSPTTTGRLAAPTRPPASPKPAARSAGGTSDPFGGGRQ